MRSQEIDQQIQEDSREMKKDLKILVLGTADPGKSTIVKQMKIVHQGGYTREELRTYRATIFHNLLESAHNIVRAMCELGVEPENRAHTERIYTDSPWTQTLKWTRRWPARFTRSGRTLSFRSL